MKRPTGFRRSVVGTRAEPRVLTLCFFLKDTPLGSYPGMALEELRTLDSLRRGHSHCGPQGWVFLGSLFLGKSRLHFWDVRAEVAHFMS